MNPLDSLVDMYMEEGMGEREALNQVKEDALKGKGMEEFEEEMADKLEDIQEDLEEASDTDPESVYAINNRVDEAIKKVSNLRDELGDVEKGVRYAQSAIGGKWYKVTEWKEVGEPEDGEQKIVAEEKVPVHKSEVPDEVLERAEHE